LEFTPQNVERFTLSNGIEVFFTEDHELPLVDIDFLIKTGENRVEPARSGLSDLLCDLIVEGGSRKVPKKAFEDSLQKVGATFRSDAANETSRYTLHLLASSVPALLPMVAGVIREPALPESQIELNKRQYISMYMSRNSEPEDVTRRVFYKLLYGKDSPRAREITPASLELITRKAMQEYHAANYRPSLFMIGVSGDFDPEVMLELLEQSFGDWKEPGKKVSLPYPLISAPAQPGVYFIQWPDAVQSSIYLGHLGILTSDPQYPEAIMFSEVYGLSWTSRIYMIIREQNGLSYSPYGWITPGFTAPGSFASVCLTKSTSTIKATGLILGIIRDLKQEGIKEAELEQAKQSWLATFPAYYEDPRQILSSRMGYAVFGFPVDFWDNMPAKIEPLTRESVSAFAERFLEPDSLIIVILGDSTALDGSVSEFGKVTVIDPEVY
jgi:zinc protease